MKKLQQISSIAISLWIMYIFLGSLPYKLTNHPDTQVIFTTIWDWLGKYLWIRFGAYFWEYGPFIIWFLEFIISILLLTWLFFTANDKLKKANRFFWVWWFCAFILMSWAVFFHLFSWLGIEVNDDSWSLFYSAVSILILWLYMSFLNLYTKQ